MAAQQSVASLDFQTANSDDILDANFDMVLAVFRAVKVFVVSHYPDLKYDENIYDEKFTNYLDVLEVLYNYQIPDRNDLYQTVMQEISGETIEITSGVKRFRGVDVLTNPRVIIITSFAQSREMNFNMNQELQQNMFFSSEVDFEEFVEYRGKVPGIRVMLQSDDTFPPEDGIKEFQMSYSEIHCEGFEDWVEFGRGVQLLIKIQFRIVDENIVHHISDKDISLFHTHTLWAMVGERILRFRDQTYKSSTGHNKLATKYKVSYIQPRIDPNSDEAFWSTPTTTTKVLDNIKRLGVTDLKGQILEKSIKFNDLQIGFDFCDELEDSFCLCSEWCNWNAFFHFNPIYRFLLVQHNLLYMKNKTNIPDIYMFVSTDFFYEAGTDPQNILEAPVLQLMSNANKYRAIFEETYNWRSPELIDMFENSEPQIQLLNCVVYNDLRYHTALADLCLQSDPNPFSDICIDNIITYYEILSLLHQQLCVDPLVDHDDEKEWFKELENISRKQYRNYMERSINKQMTILANSYDYLFSEDYEYSSVCLKSESEIEQKELRDNVLKVSNPYNIRVVCNQFVTTFVSINKFIGKVEPSIPKPHSSDAIQSMYECCRRMDRDLKNYNEDPDSPKSLKFWIPEDIWQRGFDIKSFYVFYTLKLYYIGFNIQSYSINCVYEFYNEYKYNRRLMFTELQFIWNNEVIEERLSEVYGISMLRVNDELLQEFDEFYENFWGRSDHEISYQQMGNNLIQYIDSAYFEYQRLYFWWNNDGTNKPIFKRVFQSFSNNFEDNIKRSDDILQTYIMPAIQLLAPDYPYYMEVLDHLVYYLAKANCFIVISSIASLLFQFIMLNTEELNRRDKCYVLTKPGWVQCIRSMETVLKHVNQLKALYIVFDNEFNRIANTLQQMKGLVKQLYKCLYKKVVYEWRKEILFLYNTPLTFHPLSEFLQLHFAVGVSFMAAFIDYFRYITEYQRRWITRLLARAPNANVAHQSVLKACEPIYQRYMSDKDAIKYAQPLCTIIWYEHLWQLFSQFNQNWDEQLGINMALADS